MPILQSGLGFTLKDLPKGEPVPEGTYHVRIAKAPRKVAKDAASSTEEKFPYLEIDLVVQAPEEFLGRHLFDVATLKPGVQFKLRQIMEVADWPEDTTYDDDDIESGKLSTDLEGIECLVVTTIQKGNVDKITGQQYEPRNKVQKYLPLQV